MTIALVIKFDGGIAYNPRTRNQDESQDSQGFDIFSNPNKLIPYGDSIADTMASDTVDHIRPTRVFVTSLGLTTVGYKSNSDARGTCYTKTNINDSWSANGDGAYGWALIQDSEWVFRGKLYFLANSGSDVKIQRCDGGVVVTDCGNLTGTTAIRPFVHPKNNLTTIISGSAVYTFDGTTIVTCGLTIPTGYSAISMTDYGDNIAIAMNETSGNSQSVVGIWSLNNANLEFDLIVPFGDGQIIVVATLYNILYAVMLNNSYALTQQNPRLKVKSYSGGAVDTVINLPITSSTSAYLTANTINNGKLYFALENDTAIYCLGRNQEQQIVLTHDRFINNGATANPYYLSFIGDVLFCGSISGAGVYSLMRSMIQGNTESINYTNQNFYITTINPVMGLTRYTIQDSHKQKQFPAILLEYTGIASSGNTTLQYSVDGSSFVNIINDTNAVGEQATEAGAELTSQAPLNSGREITFKMISTGASQIKQLCYEYTPIPTML